jgi:hypothetical protein
VAHNLLSSTDPQDLKEKEGWNRIRSKAGNRRRVCNQTKLQKAMLPDVTEYNIFLSMHVLYI